MVIGPDTLERGRERITQIFRFLQAFDQLRNPVIRRVQDQPWVQWLRDLPDHPAVQMAEVSGPPTDDPAMPNVPTEAAPPRDDDFVLKVSRPPTTSAPVPPAEVAEWLLRGWGDPDGRVEIIEQRDQSDEQGEMLAVRFDADKNRQSLLASWQERREAWAEKERPARQALRLFERLFELYSRIQRESERLELVLGDGILNWRTAGGGNHHPVLLQRLEIKYDPDVPPAFRLRETDHPVELYSPLFRELPDLPGANLARIREDFSQGAYHPLDGKLTSDFLGRLVGLLSSHGEYTGEGEVRGAADHPRLGRDRVIFLRLRTLGYSVALEGVLRDLETRQDLPSSLLRVVGIDTGADDLLANGGGTGLATANEDPEILLSKEANAEQLQVARQLERHGSVLVQGPPGTGKTHTIANLLGHLLSEGKTVLVTSHTTKALRVLRDKVVEELQPLCVSVLGSDKESRDQLENSVQQIINKLDISSIDQLTAEAETLQRDRNEQLIKLRDLRARLLHARADEYREVLVAGQPFTPSDAARLVRQGRGLHDWIPSPVMPGAPLPLSGEELIELYRTNMSVTAEDEEELARPLLAASDLIPADAFAKLLTERELLATQDLRHGERYWWRAPESQNAAELTTLVERVGAAVAPLRETDRWKLNAILAGRLGGDHRVAWDTLLTTIASVHGQAARAHPAIMQHGPTLSSETEASEQARVLGEIVTHLEQGRSLNWWAKSWHSEWRALLPQVRVGGRAPRDLGAFRALHQLALLTVSRQELVKLWERMISDFDGPTVADLGAEPEAVCIQFVPHISAFLDWHTLTWLPVEQALDQAGFRWSALLQEEPPNLSVYGDSLRIRDATLDRVPPIFLARIALIRWIQIHQILARLAEALAPLIYGPAPANVAVRLYEAVLRLNADAYRSAYLRLVELERLRPIMNRRHELIQRLKTAAPGWATAIRDRRTPHDEASPPGDAVKAWLWRQLNDELEARGATSIPELQQDIEAGTKQLHVLTTKLIDRRAWAGELKRANRLDHRQSLMGWRDAVRRQGAGTGRRVPRLQALARRLMAQCRTAVPVWIMPLARVAENFDPTDARFDVVIIDEASQSDVLGLLAFYLGKQVLIVGDDKQVSPLAVGLSTDQVDRLIDEHLQGIPNAELYDGQFSIYKLAGQSSSGSTMLTEHFRCVPEIIQFSNHLSYDGKIKPLRDSSAVDLKPATIAYQVEGTSTRNNVNHVEALTVASLLVAAIEQPEYKDKTFGVISMVGDQQALAIDALLRSHLSTDEYIRRQIIAGNSAQFQGDERDVMFLSMVDDPPEHPPLALRQTELFQQRYNVAASRAADQMWVVYSLNAQTDVQSNDLRRRLIAHALST